ncbi:unnamed protein product, partial [marine sediment metagenome]
MRYAIIADIHSNLAAFTAVLADIDQRGGVDEIWCLGDVVGGDTSSAPVVAITITILGSTRSQGKHILTRSTAKPGEKIAVTGYLGAAASGSEMLAKRLQFDPE